MSELATYPALCRRCHRSRLALSFVVALVAILDVLPLAGVVVVAPDGTFHFSFSKLL